MRLNSVLFLTLIVSNLVLNETKDEDEDGNGKKRSGADTDGRRAAPRRAACGALSHTNHNYFKDDDRTAMAAASSDLTIYV